MLSRAVQTRQSVRASSRCKKITFIWKINPAKAHYVNLDVFQSEACPFKTNHRLMMHRGHSPGIVWPVNAAAYSAVGSWRTPACESVRT
jgi:hypothetical protein